MKRNLSVKNLYKILILLICCKTSFADLTADPCFSSLPWKEAVQQFTDYLDKLLVTPEGQAITQQSSTNEAGRKLFRLLIKSKKGSHLLFETCAGQEFLPYFEPARQMIYEKSIRKFPRKNFKLLDDLSWAKLEQVRQSNPKRVEVGMNIIIENCDSYPEVLGGLNQVILSVREALSRDIQCLKNNGRIHDAALLIEFFKRSYPIPLSIRCVSRENYTPLNRTDLSYDGWFGELIPPIIPTLGYPAFKINVSRLLKEQVLRNEDSKLLLLATIGHEAIHLLGYLHKDKIKEKLNIDVTSSVEDCCFKNKESACNDLKNAPTNEFNVNEDL